MIADRLKIIMDGLSGREFAAKLGKSPTTVNEYLKGRVPPADFVELVCVHFGVDPWWLLTGEGPMMRGEESKVGEGKVNVELHVAVLNVVDELLEAMEKQPTREQKSRLVAALYHLASERKDHSIDRTTALQLVKLMAA